MSAKTSMGVVTHPNFEYAKLTKSMRNACVAHDSTQGNNITVHGAPISVVELVTTVSMNYSASGVDYAAQQVGGTAKQCLSGIALLCSLDAVVIRIVYDGLGISGQSFAGTSLNSMFESSCIRKGHDFLRRIRDQKHADHWALDIVAEGRTVPLWFSGSDHAGLLRIVGALTCDAADEISRKYLAGDDPREGTAAHIELVEKNMELERRIAEKSEWLLAASHDLRNHVYALSCWAQMLREEPIDNPALQPREVAAAISASAEFMLRLVNDLEDITTADSVMLRPAIVPTDLLGIVRESIALSRPCASLKATNLELISRLPALVIPADAEKIRRVLLNIIENAVKYSQPGALVQVGIITQKGKVLISVRDNGPGIPADEINSVFTPFQRTRARAACVDPGTGLGLAICKRIVEQHGGRLSVESTFGHGTTFNIELPSETTRGSSVLWKKS